jgi:hypothetical protein
MPAILTDEPLRLVGVLCWLICLASLLPAVVRLITGRGRYLDPLLALIFLLAVNRLTFLFRVSWEGSQMTAAVLALIMAGFSIWYQRHDA